MQDAERRKEDRRRAHSAPGSMPRESVRKRRIIKEIEWISVVGYQWEEDLGVSRPYKIHV